MKAKPTVKKASAQDWLAVLKALTANQKQASYHMRKAEIIAILASLR